MPTSGMVGEYYSGSIEATFVRENKEDYVRWDVTGSPPWLYYYADDYSGYITFYGYPDEGGEYSFTVVAIHATTNEQSAPAPVSFTIAAPPPLPAPIFITTSPLPNGVAGVDYRYDSDDGTKASVRILAEVYDDNGEPADGYNVKWSWSGNTPPGLYIQNGGGNWGESVAHIEGTPMAAGTYTFTVTANNQGGKDTRQFTITIDNPPPPSLISRNTDPPPAGRVGENYGYFVAWLTEGIYDIDDNNTLPQGLAISQYNDWVCDDDKNSCGERRRVDIYGTPTQSGSRNVTLTVSNTGGSLQPPITFSITIQAPAAPVIAEVQVPEEWEVGVDFSGYITTCNYTMYNYSCTYVESWSIVSGSLPLGLDTSWNSNVLNISGRPSQTGTFTFMVEARNQTDYDRRQVTIKIIPLKAPVITTEFLPNGEIGVYYDSIVEAQGANITEMTAKGLPAGLDYYQSGNYLYIYGTPTAIGISTVTVTATNSANVSVSKPITLQVTAQQPPVITTASLPVGEMNQYYYEYIDAAGSNITSFTVTGLPAGLRYYWYEYGNGYGEKYIYISGNPTEHGTFPVTVTATNAAGTGTKNLNMVINPPQLPVITSSNMPSTGHTGVDYEGRVYATGYDIEWSVSGNLPRGLTYTKGTEWDNQNNVDVPYFEVYGTPTTPATYTFSVVATNKVGSVSAQFSVVISGTALPLPPTPIIETSSLTSGVVGNDYYTSITAEVLGGEVGPVEPCDPKYDPKCNPIIPATYAGGVRWSVISGSLPPGLQMDWGSGGDGFSYTSISGTPTQAGTYTFTVEANNRGSKTTHPFTITVTTPPPPVITTASLPDGLIGDNYNHNINVSVMNSVGCGGAWSLVGNSPPGLDIYDECYGAMGWAYISGTPTVVGKYTFTVEADFGLKGKATKQYTINIVPEVTPFPTITAQPVGNSSLAEGSVYTLSVTASVSGANGLDYQLHYQWYSNTTSSTTGGTAISGATARTYTVPTATDGTKYYYVTVTNNIAFNTGNGEEVRSSVPVSSGVAAITIKPAPKYTVPTGLTATYGALLSSVNLNLPAPDNGVWSWENPTVTVGNVGTRTHSAKFTPTDNSFGTETGVSVSITVNKAAGSFGTPSALTATYAPTLTLGSLSLPSGYVFNAPTTALSAGNNQSFAATYTDPSGNYTSAAGNITVNVAKAAPSVTWPSGLAAKVGQTLADISLASYTNAGGTAGAFSWTTPSTAVGASGAHFHSMTFTPTAAANYSTVTQNVSVAVTTVSVLESDRVVPTGKPNEEATVIAPVSQLSGEFTAGPNPVLKQSGIVNFYRQGKRVSNSELRIYDANGNVINKVKINDKAMGSQARRQVGTWDLCDRNGRIVPEGTYLVKGVVKTSDGKKEKVSLIIGVR
jgi:PKD repeat protein